MTFLVKNKYFNNTILPKLLQDERRVIETPLLTKITQLESTIQDVSTKYSNSTMDKDKVGVCMCMCIGVYRCVYKCI